MGKGLEILVSELQKQNQILQIARQEAEEKTRFFEEKAKLEELKNASKKIQNTDAPAKVYMSDLERGKKYF